MLLQKIKNAFAEGGFRGFCSKAKAKAEILFFRVIYGIHCRGQYILLESVPNLSDNTKEVYDEMIRRGMNKKYHILWICWKDEERKLPEKNCGTLNFKRDTNRSSEKVGAILKRTKCVVCCNRFVKANVPGAKTFFLTHGSPIKSTRNYYNVPKDFDYCVSPAQAMNGIISYEFNYPPEKVVPLGFPRNDAFARAHGNPTELFPNRYDKIIVWYPTYRQHAKWEARTNSTNAIPILHNADLAARLNEYAKSLNVLIVLKPHFAQNVSYITDLKLSNILFIDDSFFETHKISSYEFIGSCDALLTDYSSVYFDYLLADKPIGAVWEDIEEYRENPGFALDLDHYMAGAEKIYTIDDLERFVGNVVSGNDIFAKERRAVCEEVNYSYDGKNAERVVDFIVEKSNL